MLIAALLTLQIVVPVIAQSGCLSPCSDDDADGDCSPVCITCLSCPHSRFAITAEADPELSAAEIGTVVAQLTDGFPLQISAEILHVPLLG